MNNAVKILVQSKIIFLIFMNKIRRSSKIFLKNDSFVKNWSKKVSFINAYNENWNNSGPWYHKYIEPDKVSNYGHTGRFGRVQLQHERNFKIRGFEGIIWTAIMPKQKSNDPGINPGFPLVHSAQTFQFQITNKYKSNGQYQLYN